MEYLGCFSRAPNPFSKIVKVGQNNGGFYQIGRDRWHLLPDCSWIVIKPSGKRFELVSIITHNQEIIEPREKERGKLQEFYSEEIPVAIFAKDEIRREVRVFKGPEYENVEQIIQLITNNGIFEEVLYPPYGRDLWIG